MIYQVKIDKPVRNVRVYVITKRLGRSPSIVTKLFMKILGQEGVKAEKDSATEKLR